MKVLVLVGQYPDPDGHLAQHFIHVRNVAYQKNGIDVTVLCFSARANYVYDGIKVITLNEFKRQHKSEHYDIAIFQQPNIRYHFKFVIRYGKQFDRFIWFFHGQEVLRIYKTYSKPYSYMRPSIFRRTAQNAYDSIKLSIWRNYYRKVAYKSHFVYVSKWMLDEFLKSTRISFELIKGRYSVTYNCIGSTFERTEYSSEIEKKYDFVTIRNIMDGSKYCIDFVNGLAKANPDLSFLAIGEGHFFEHYEKADNLTWKEGIMNHHEIVDILQIARCALMPTRTDAQGLMMCEMASIGMPVITSDIPVCHEVFDDFENVALIPNDDLSVDLNGICKRLEEKLPYKKNEKYFNKNTSAKEIELIRKIYNEIGQ